MDSHALFKSAKLEDLPHLLELPPSTVSELAAPATPEAARREVLDQVAAGEKPTTTQVFILLDEAIRLSPSARRPEATDSPPHKRAYEAPSFQGLLKSGFGSQSGKPTASVLTPACSQNRTIVPIPLKASAQSNPQSSLGSSVLVTAKRFFQ